MPHIGVIGAGVTGILTASSLLDRGFRVTVLERARYAAMFTSYANGGQLSASNAETWNQWGTILKGLRWIARRNAPLLVNPKPSWHKYSWMTEFVAAIPRFRTNTIETARLAIAARSLLLEKAERHAIEFDCETRGILHIFSNRDAFRYALNINRLLAEAGLDRQCVTPDEIRRIEPAWKGDIYGG